MSRAFGTTRSAAADGDRQGSLPASRRDRATRVAVAAALFVAVCVVFAPVVHNDFVTVDDPLYVTSNRHVRTGLTWEGVRWAFGNGDARLWHPVTWLSHMADVEAYGVRPRGHHVTSLLIHAANASLAFLVLSGLTGAVWRSGVVAALFALHPLRVESVAWVAERKDVLCVLFVLLTLGAYRRYAALPSRSRLAAVAGCHALALMAKPIAVTVPALLLLLDYWPLRRLRAPEQLWQRVREKALLLALSAAVATATVLVAESAIESHPVTGRLGNAAVSYVRYLAKWIWPTDLAFFYPLPARWPAEGMLASLVLLLLLSAGAWSARQRAPYLVVGWLWFVGSLLPAIGLVQAGPQAMADRFTYLPSIGLSLAAVWGVAAVVPPVPVAAAALGTALAVAALGVTSRSLARYWRNTETLCRRAIEVTTDNFFAHGALAGHLIDEGRLAEAKGHVLEALRVKPDNPVDRHRLGLLLGSEGRIDLAERELAYAARRSPDKAAYRFNHGVALHKLGRVDAAIDEYREAVRLDPEYVDAWHGLAVGLGQRGRAAEASDAYTNARRLRPSLPAAPAVPPAR